MWLLEGGCKEPTELSETLAGVLLDGESLDDKFASVSVLARAVVARKSEARAE